MIFDFGINPWILLLAILCAAALTYWTYSRSRPLLPMSKRVPLMLLRFLALSLILSLLFEPIFRWIQRQSQKPTFALLIDTSKSTGLHPNSVKDALNKLKLPDLNAKIQVYTFDSDTKAAPNNAYDNLKFNGDRTDMVKALNRVREDLGDQNLGGVMVISDGQYNTGRNPSFLAERFPVPIHTIAVGDTTKQRDVQVRRAVTNEVAYINTELPVQVGIRAHGFDGQQANVTLSDGGRTIASTSVRLDGSNETTANLLFRPTQTGLRKLTATVSQLSGELTYSNNSTTITVRVLDNKLKVLLLGGVPNPDLSAMQQVLGSDPTLQVTTFVQKAPNQYYEGALPSSLSNFDLLILSGFPGPGTSQADVQKVAEAAKVGKAVFFMIGQQTNLNLVRDVLGDVLPVKPTVVRNSVTEASFFPSSSGAIHPVLEISDPKPEDWKLLPPLYFNQSRWELAGDARILASPQVNGVVLPDPLLVVRTRGRIRSAALLGSGIFRWRSLPADLASLTHFLPSITSNTLRWVTSAQDDRPVRIRSTRTLFGGAESVQFVGQIYDENLNPVDRANVEVKVNLANGETKTASLNPLGNGRYFADIGVLAEGSYTYTASASANGASLGTDGGSFAVGALTLEFQDTNANLPLMRNLAEKSGGIFLMANQSTQFLPKLTNAGGLKPTYIERETEIEPHTIWWLLMVILTLLSLEWFFRKRNAML